MKQSSARKTAHCRKASLKHGIYSATMFSARAYLRRLAEFLHCETNSVRADRLNCPLASHESPPHRAQPCEHQSEGARKRHRRHGRQKEGMGLSIKEALSDNLT